MNQDIAEVFFPCLGGAVIFSLVAALIIGMRYLKYRETIYLADKGLVRPEPITTMNMRTLRWGIILIAIGMALCIGLWPIGFVSDNRWPLGLGPWMLAGLLPLFFGLGLTFIFYLTRESSGISAGAADKPIAQAATSSSAIEESTPPSVP